MVLAACLVPTAAVNADGPNVTDISGTSRGRQAVADAGRLFAAQGVTIGTDRLRVHQIEQDLIVVPDTVTLSSATVARVRRGDRTALENVVQLLVGSGAASPDEAITASAGALLAAAPYWQEKERGCFAWLRKGGSFMAPCYYIHKLVNDGDGSRDYYTLKYKATVGTDRFGSGNYDAWIESIRTSGSYRQYWYDWEPGADVSGNCGETSLSFAVKGVMATFSATRCERWDMTLWQDAGHFRNKWNCDCWIPVAQDRQVAFQIGVATDQSRTPLWTVSAGFSGF